MDSRVKQVSRIRCMVPVSPGYIIWNNDELFEKIGFVVIMFYCLSPTAMLNRAIMVMVLLQILFYGVTSPILT